MLDSGEPKILYPSTPWPRERRERREAARGLSTGERKMLHSAKEILLSELAMVREIGYQEAERLLDGAVMTGACE